MDVGRYKLIYSEPNESQYHNLGNEKDDKGCRHRVTMFHSYAKSVVAGKYIIKHTAIFIKKKRILI